MIQDILKYRDQGLSFREIARELNSTVGKVHYSWTKYVKDHEIGNEDSPQLEFQLPQSLPSPNQDCMCLMVQNSTSLYLYWDISKAKIQFIETNFQKSFSSMTKYIKIYHITSILFNGHNAHREFEIALPEMTNNWFVREVEPNQTYIAELGVKTEEGTFFTIARSNPIDTPRDDVNQAGLFTESVHEWKQGQSSSPAWLENFSTYSYYEKLLRK
ncbi:DUF4912 domain-containing protein [Bacillus sp. BGMRC 2118]|nr:DUF4912 domain-containing protein [Bacillus sp. BGMRC 2118]